MPARLERLSNHVHERPTGADRLTHRALPARGGPARGRKAMNPKGKVTRHRAVPARGGPAPGPATRPGWRFLRAAVLAVAVGPAVAACAGGPDARSGWEATTDTIGDTIVVRTTGGSVWGEPRTLVPEVTIGVLEGDEAYMLGAINGLAVSADGAIYALDRQVPMLRKYGDDGRHIADFGREGGGPGEYKNPDGGLAVLSDGRVAVRDPGNARIQVFSVEGVPLAEWPLPSGGGFSTSRKLYRDGNDRLYSMVVRDRAVSVDLWRFDLAVIEPDGSHTDTMSVPIWDYENPVVTAKSENSSMSNNVPFSASTMWTYSPKGYFVGGLSTGYRVEVFRTGDLPIRIERVWEPVPITTAEKADAQERTTRNFQQSFPGWRWNGPPIPDTKPPFRSISVGDDGRIWVMLSQPSTEIMTEAEARIEFERTQRVPTRFRERVAFDVFESDGSYLGRAATPEGFSTFPEPVFRGDHVWATLRDENDVVYIVRFRISGTPVE
jgi:hypothetical protein